MTIFLGSDYRQWRWSNLAGARSCRGRPDAQGQRTGRRHRHLPPGGAAVHRQADRAGAELRRPGRDRHREHAAAQRTAAIACSSRPRPPTCSRSSAARPSICRPCSTRWSSRPRGCARPTGGHSSAARRMMSTVTVATYGFAPRLPRIVMRANAASTPDEVAYRSGALSKARSIQIAGRASRSGIHLASSRDERGGYRTMLGVPLLREGDTRRRADVCTADVEPFTDKQIELADHLRRPGRDRHRERAAVRRNPGQEPPARGGEPAQVAVPRQHEPRAAHAAQRHPRLHRIDHRRHLRRDAGEGAGRAQARREQRQATCSA